MKTKIDLSPDISRNPTAKELAEDNYAQQVMGRPTVREKENPDRAEVLFAASQNVKGRIRKVLDQSTGNQQITCTYFQNTIIYLNNLERFIKRFLLFA